MNFFHKIIRRHGSRLFGVSKAEAVRVFYAFLIKFLFQIAFLSGGTLLTALYIETYSLESLPLFFMIQSLFVVVGTWSFAGFLRRFAPSTMIIFGSFIASFLLIFSFLFIATPIVFIGLVTIAMCIFMAQVSIWISLFIENLFSPLESERVFPVIESSDPIGGILTGIVMVGLVTIINAAQMLLIVAIVLALLPSVLLFSLRTLESIPVLKIRRENRNHAHASRNMFLNFIHFFRQNTFVTLLFVVVFLLSSMTYFLEYQFTEVVDAHIQTSNALVYGPQVQNSYDYANAITHSFGTLQILIFGVLFFIQLLFSSKILQRIGVVHTFALFPLFSFFAFAMMSFSFGYTTVALAKGVFKIGKGISKNAFLSSFYVLKETVRNEVKEVLDGIAKPIGLFMGTLALLLMQATISPENIHHISAVFLTLVSLISFFIALMMRHHYTCANNTKLETLIDLPEKIEAIEILGQPGHIDGMETLVAILKNEKEIPEIKVKVLNILGKLKNQKSITAILCCLEEKEDTHVQLAAVKALQHFDNLGKKFFQQAFSVYSVQQSLKKLFMSTYDNDIKVGVIKVFANLKDPEIIPFLVDTLSSKDPKIRAESALVCGMFHDVGTISHVKPLLKDRHPAVRAAAIIALWQFDEIRKPMLAPVMDFLLHSDNEEAIVAGMRAAGWTKNTYRKKELLEFLESKNHRIRRHAAAALIQMNESKAHKPLMEYLFHEEKVMGIKTKKMIESFDRGTQDAVHKITLQEGLQRITYILKNAKTSILENLKREELHELLHLFHLVNAEREIWKIRMILRERGDVEPIYA